MPINLQQFLANAQDLVVPSSTGLATVREFLTQMLGVIDLTPQSVEIEYDSHLLTTVIGSTPQFNLPPVAIGQTHRYHHISVQRLDNPNAAATWFVSVTYPSIGQPIEVIRTDVAEAFMLDLLASKFSSAAGTIVRNAQPLIVWPRGALIIQRGAAIGAGERTRVNIVREVRGGPGSSEPSTDLGGGFV